MNRSGTGEAKCESPVSRVKIRYRWRYYDELRGRYFTTRHWAAAEDFLPSHPGATPIEGTHQELVLSGDPLTATSMARFNTGPPDL